MALHINAPTFAIGWSQLLKAIHDYGKESNPRDQKTREIMNVCFEVKNGLHNIFVNNVRQLNYRFMIAEFLWIMAGLDDVETIASYNSIMRKFSDDGAILSGAYGPRLSFQWDYVISALKKTDSRQAVATIWTPNPKDSKDVPCTISLQWFIREGNLHCTINMRSSDIWLGLPYDFFTFSQLTNMVASVLHIPVGSITMNLASSHLYESSFASADECIHNSIQESVESPALPSYVYQPSNEEIVGILKGTLGVEHFTNPIWKAYNLALKKNKSSALGVLYELSRYKG